MARIEVKESDVRSMPLASDQSLCIVCRACMGNASRVCTATKTASSLKSVRLFRANSVEMQIF